MSAAHIGSRVSLAVVFLVLSAAGLWAADSGQPPSGQTSQEPTGNTALQQIQSTLQQMDGKLDRLEQRISALEQNGAAPDTSTNAAGALVPVKTSEPGRIEALESRVYELEVGQGQLYQEVVNAKSVLSKVPGLGDRVYELEVVQGQIATTIQAPNGDRVSVPAILANMDRSPAFRDQMNRAVHAVMQQHQGKLLIENRTSTGQTIRVLNTGQYVYIPPGQISAPISVPVGTVSTELVGQEAPKNWVVGPPNYEQRIVINPRPSSVWIGSPGYVWDPLWGWVVYR